MAEQTRPQHHPACDSQLGPDFEVEPGVMRMMIFACLGGCWDEFENDAAEVTSLAEIKRTLEAQADPRCECGNYPAVCSPMGRPCCFRPARTEGDE